MPRLGESVRAPIDRCLRLARALPIPQGMTDRDRDILWAAITRRITRRSMGAIGAEYGISAGRVREVAVRVMERMGIWGLTHDDPAYRSPYAETPDAVVVEMSRWVGERRGPYDGAM